VFDIINPGFKHTACTLQPNEHSSVNYVLFYNDAAVNDYELPVIRSSTLTPDGYVETHFDGELEAESSGDGPQENTITSQEYANSNVHDHRSQSFVQPHANLHSLLAQIKETKVMEIQSQSIWYVLDVYLGMSV